MTMRSTEKPERKILSVSQLTTMIKRLLELQVGDIWLRGEISNLRVPSSGHAYFTLKDAGAQISAVMFKGRLSPLKIDLKDGMEVIAFGKISVYEPRGNYQIILEFIEPAGLGLLQAAFEQLKEKLAKEGLFEPARKRKLPFFPRRIGIVTSPTGAAIRDMLHILQRRNPLVRVLLAPAKVQGEGAAAEIARGIEWLNDYNLSCDESERLDLLIVGRGGGSLEDLWSFNEEIVARAIFKSTLPVISAVGHEIDFTIADFVADLRAPTPSAAAEVAVPVLSELQERVRDLRHGLEGAMRATIDVRQDAVQSFSQRLIRPDRRLADLRLRLDDWRERLIQTQRLGFNRRRENLLNLRQLLVRASPRRRYSEIKLLLGHWQQRQGRAVQQYLHRARASLAARSEQLQALSPLNILGRGYSVARDATSKDVLKSRTDFTPGRAFELTVQDGVVQAQVAGSAPREKGPGPAKASSPAGRSNPQGRLL